MMDASPAPPQLAQAAAFRWQDLTQHLQRLQGFSAVVEALGAGKSATIDGAWKSSAALAAAAVGLQAPRTVLLVLAHPGDVDFWNEDLLTFSGRRAVTFPAWDAWPPRNAVIDEIAGQRLRVLRQLDADEPRQFVLTTIQALLEPVPNREQLAQQRRRLRMGEQVDLDELTAWLVEHGFQRMEAVEIPGEFSRRGGILDVFSPDAEVPYRIEFFGDEIDSIRQFSTETQRSLARVPAAEIVATSFWLNRDIVEENGEEQPPKIDFTGHLCDWLPAESWVILVEPEELQEQGKHLLERVSSIEGLFSLDGAFRQLGHFATLFLSALPAAPMGPTCHLRMESVERFSGDVSRVREELDGISDTDQVVVACRNEGSKNRLAEVLKEGRLARSGRLHLVQGHLHAGFRLVEAGIAVLGDHELFHREDVRRVLPRRKLESRAIDSFLDLQENDLVVHVSHGIARYRGMQILTNKGQSEEHLILEFRGGLRVYVPVSKIDLVQKYVGATAAQPELSKFGGASWQRKKERVAAAVLDMASDMLELQALRQSQAGIAYPPDTEWQTEFESSFPYQETPDQLTSLAEIKEDMQRTRPMDRLICGDVGYGKTELSIRAAFKAVDSGRQVAVLVPTTVLAEQHYRTFSQRLAEYPFNVAVISRFRTGARQRQILQSLARGGIDVIIGTHRLLSADVTFKDLGLVVIDEEQRFGVEHKERLKRLRQTVDVLTMTATPIPRTLHLSLLGIRDISNLETPPRDRLSIETRIVRFDPTLIRHAVLRELNREGQIYFVHNRVHNIHEIANQLQSIVPEARITVGHGQMAEHELEEAMVRFVNHDADILVATTIIESGLDIPNANTIFINQADKYGLADLHQLRGRVGRYKHRAYAYLLIDNERTITPVASRRLKAIEEFTELGAGFKIAMRDLEIRGTGNILGTQQSGHIAAVGYELYCQLLDTAVRQLKKQPVRAPFEVTIDLPWPALLPREYISAQRTKIEVYRRLSRVRTMDRLEDFRRELHDRFGKPPKAVEWLLRLAELRLLASRWRIGAIYLEGQGVPDRKQPDKDLTAGATDVVLGYRHPRRIKELAARSDGRLRIVDDRAAYFRLKPGELAPPKMYLTLKHLLRFP